MLNSGIANDSHSHQSVNENALFLNHLGNVHFGNELDFKFTAIVENQSLSKNDSHLHLTI